MSKNNDRQIAPVSDNKDKQQTYRHQLGRYKIALREGFYFEAMLIVYAMIEDRLRSFLYYIGAIRKFDSSSLNVEKSKTQLRNLFSVDDPNKKISINQYSVKSDLILKTLELIYNPELSDDYLILLKDEYIRCVDIGGLRDVLTAANDWCKYRNEIIHGLLNKNVTSLDSEIHEKVEQGMAYGRFIDNQVKELKKRNAIRKHLNLK